MLRQPRRCAYCGARWRLRLQMLRCVVQKEPTEAEFRKQMWVMQVYSPLRSYRFGDARDAFKKYKESTDRDVFICVKIFVNTIKATESIRALTLQPLLWRGLFVIFYNYKQNY